MPCLVVLVLPSPVFPKAFHDVWLVLKVLGVSVLASGLSGKFAINHISTPFQHKATTLKVLRRTVLSVILALRVCAYLYDSY